MNFSPFVIISTGKLPASISDVFVTCSQYSTKAFFVKKLLQTQLASNNTAYEGYLYIATLG